MLYQLKALWFSSMRLCFLNLEQWKDSSSYLSSLGDQFARWTSTFSYIIMRHTSSWCRRRWCLQIDCSPCHQQIWPWAILHPSFLWYWLQCQTRGKHFCYFMVSCLFENYWSWDTQSLFPAASRKTIRQNTKSLPLVTMSSLGWKLHMPIRKHEMTFNMYSLNGEIYILCVNTFLTGVCFFIMPFRSNIVS